MANVYYKLSDDDASKLYYSNTQFDGYKKWTTMPVVIPTKNKNVVLSDPFKFPANATMLFHSALSISGIERANTSECTNMTGLFLDYQGESLDLHRWDTSKVTTIENIFYGCQRLTSLNVLGWNTMNVQSMRQAFMQCTKLTTLDLSSWNFDKVQDFYQCFFNDRHITSIYVPPGTDWSVVDFDDGSLFYECTKVHNWDSVTNKTRANDGSRGYFMPKKYWRKVTSYIKDENDEWKLSDVFLYFDGWGWKEEEVFR